MSDIGDLIAFRAALEMTDQATIEAIYRKCIAQRSKPKAQMVNYISHIYAPFSDTGLSHKIAELITPADVQCPVKIIFQERESLTRICSEHNGNWYFTGEYPTPGGMYQLNNSFIDFYERNVELK